MAEVALDITTDAEIDAALLRAQHVPDRAEAVAARYDSGVDAIVLDLNNGRRLLLPRDEIQGLEKATLAEMSRIEIHGGVDIAWPLLDLDHYLPHMLAGRYGGAKWMASMERRGLPDTPNNSPASVARMKAGYILEDFLSPFLNTHGKELRGVLERKQESALAQIGFVFDSKVLVLGVGPGPDTIELTLQDRLEEANDVSHTRPWRHWIGKPVERCWASMNQWGYWDTVQLAFGGTIPDISLTVLSYELNLRQLLPMKAEADH